MPGPNSLYSSRVIHWLEKDPRLASTLPPIHTRYLRSGGATTRTEAAGGASAVTSLVSLGHAPRKRSGRRGKRQGGDAGWGEAVSGG